jgi:type I restriction enzyme S subunit
VKGWPAVPFGEALTDASGGNRKTPQSEYLPRGLLPVVDQGKAFIAGYTNDESRAYKGDLPVIVFGDHTRAVKYVDFPFSRGADGVKILHAQPGWSTKFLYHYLTQVELPLAGYSRHFKFLKDITVPRPPLDEQRRIADLLDRADALRAPREQSLALLDSLTDSLFFAIFGHIEEQPVARAGESLLIPLRNGLSPSKVGTVHGTVLTLAAITSGRFRREAFKRATFDREPAADQRVNTCDFLICRGNGNRELVGSGVFPDLDMPHVAYPDTAIAARFDQRRLNPRYLQHLWKSPTVRGQIDRVARTTNGTYKINHQMIQALELPTPGIELQEAFSFRVSRIDRLRVQKHWQVQQMDALVASLRNRAFRGEL